MPVQELDLNPLDIFMRQAEDDEEEQPQEFNPLDDFILGDQNQRRQREAPAALEPDQDNPIEEFIFGAGGSQRLRAADQQREERQQRIEQQGTQLDESIQTFARGTFRPAVTMDRPSERDIERTIAGLQEEYPEFRDYLATPDAQLAIRRQFTAAHAHGRLERAVRNMGTMYDKDGNRTNNLDEAVRINIGSEVGGFRGDVRSRQIRRLVPFSGGGLRISEAEWRRQAWQNIQGGQAGETDWDEAAFETIENINSRGRSIGELVRDGLIELPTFVAEIYATGGLGGAAGRGAATAAVRGLVSAGAGRTGVRVGANAAAWAARAAAQAPLTLSVVGRGYEHARRVPTDISDGQVHAQPEQARGVGESLARGLGQSYIENLSEGASAAVPILGRWLGRTGAAERSTLVRSLATRMARESDLGRRALFHGLPAEWAEERLADVLNGVVGLHVEDFGDFGPTQDLLAGRLPEALNQFASEAIVLGAYGGGMNAANRLSMTRLDSTRQRAFESLRRSGLSEQAAEQRIRAAQQAAFEGGEIGEGPLGAYQRAIAEELVPAFRPGQARQAVEGFEQEGRQQVDRNRAALEEGLEQTRYGINSDMRATFGVEDPGQGQGFPQVPAQERSLSDFVRDVQPSQQQSNTVQESQAPAVPEAVRSEAPVAPQSNAPQIQETGTQADPFPKIDQGQREFIEKKIQELGSVEAVNAAYPMKMGNVAKYARFRAGQVFGANQPAAPVNQTAPEVNKPAPIVNSAAPSAQSPPSVDRLAEIAGRRFNPTRTANYIENLFESKKEIAVDEIIEKLNRHRRSLGQTALHPEELQPFLDEMETQDRLEQISEGTYQRPEPEPTADEQAEIERMIAEARAAKQAQRQIEQSEALRDTAQAALARQQQETPPQAEPPIPAVQNAPSAAQIDLARELGLSETGTAAELAERIRAEEEEAKFAKQQPAKQPRKRRSRAKPEAVLYNAVLSHGGLNRAKVEKDRNISEEFTSYGLGGLFRKNAKFGLDEMADSLQAEGHIRAPEGQNADEYLLEMLQQRKLSLLSEVDDSAYLKAQRELYEAEEAARRAGANPDAIRSRRKRGEEAAGTGDAGGRGESDRGGSGEVDADESFVGDSFEPVGTSAADVGDFNPSEFDKQALPGMGAAEAPVQKTPPVTPMKPSTVRPSTAAPPAGAMSLNALSDWTRKGQSALSWLKKWFTSAGHLPAESFDAMIRRDGRIASYTDDIRNINKDLRAAVKKDFGVKYEQVDEKQLRTMNEALQGDIYAKLALRQFQPNTAAVIETMREQIDLLSRALIQNGATSVAMTATIDANLGVYLNRAYRVFDDPKWAESVPVDIRNRFKSWLRAERLHQEFRAWYAGQLKGQRARQRQEEQLSIGDQLPEGIVVGIDSSGIAVRKQNGQFERIRKPQYQLTTRQLYDTWKSQRARAAQQITDGQLDLEMRRLLYNGTAAESPIKFISGAKLGSKDLSVFIRRKGVPVELRELWGEYTDPLINLNHTISRMAHLLSNQMFQNEAVDAGMGNYFFMEEMTDPSGTSTVQIAPDQSETMGRLAGLWTTPEIKKAFEEVYSKENLSWGWRLYRKLMGFTKYSKTILSHPTYFVNFFGNSLNMVAHGYWRFNKIADVVQVMSQDTQQMRDRYRRYVELRVVEDGVHAGEIQAFSRDLLGDREKAADIVGRNRHTVDRWIRGTLRAGERIYRASDSVFKIFAFEHEKADLRTAYPNWTEQQIEEEAAEKVRGVTTMYSLLPKAVKSLRTNPVTAPFASFPAAVLRSVYHTVRLTAQELKTPETRHIGARRLAGMMMAAAMPRALAMMSRLLLGVDGDDDEDARRMMPEWVRNSSCIIYTGRDADGNLRYIDLGRFDFYSILNEPLTALLRGDTELMTNPAAEAARPFLLDEEFLTGKLVDVARNTTANGREVYNPQAPATQRWLDSASHVKEAFVPGSVTAANRLRMAATGQVNQQTGQRYGVGDEAAGQFGLRPQTVDVAMSLRFQARDFLSARTDATRLLTGVARQGGAVSDQQLGRAHETMESRRQELYEDMRQNVLAAQNLGLTKEEVEGILDAAGVSENDRSDLLTGRYRQWAPESGFLQSSARGDVATPDEMSRRESTIATNATTRMDQEQRNEMAGPLLYQMTDPRPTRSPRESTQHYQERVQRWRADVERARNSLGRLNLSAQERTRLLNAEWRRRGLAITSQSLRERMGRLR